MIAMRQGRLSRRAMLQASGAAMVGGLATACGAPGPAAAPPTADLEALAMRYTRLALRLAKHQPSLVERWMGADIAEGPRVPAPVLRAESAALLADATAQITTPAQQRQERAARAAGDHGAADGVPDDRDRASYLMGQIRALDEAAGRLLGESHPFTEEARRTFGHVAPPRDAAALERLRTELAALLPGPGALADRHAAYRRAAAVPPDRVEAVFRAAVDWCRDSARAHIPLPPGESLTTRAEDTAGWAAFSRPTGPLTSDLWVARRGGADPAHLLQLAAHEGTPGHHAQHVLAMAQLATARKWVERQLHPAFGPHLLAAEGTADAGADLLLPLEVRERLCREALLPAAGLPPAMAATLVRVERLAAALDLEVAYIAADYLDTSLGSETATDRLRADALVLDPPGMLAFIEKQRAKMLAYPVGRRLAIAALGTGTVESRWARLTTVATTLSLDRWLEE